MVNENIDKELTIAAICDIRCLRNSIISKNIILNCDLEEQLLYTLITELNSQQIKVLWNTLIKNGIIIIDSEYEYEVEDILDEKIFEDKKYYLVKWKGWPIHFNEWVNETDLNCEMILTNYKNDLHPCQFPIKDMQCFVNFLSSCAVLSKDLILECCNIVDMFKNLLLVKRAKRLNKFKSNAFSRLNNARLKSNKDLKTLQFDLLKKWEDHINQIEQSRSRITIENNVDMTGPPEDFIYINKRIAGKGVQLDDFNSCFGCSCVNCYSEKNSCCASQFDSPFAYNKNKKLKLNQKFLIIECNMMCKCGPDCLNRVIQKGRNYRIAIFRTSNGKGWGVKTLDPIKKGSFVIEYIGEVITNEEAESRGLEYDNEGMTYLFDLDFPDYDLNEYSIDAKTYGNASHFINHSCDPNLDVYPVLDNNLNIKLHKLCFFANRDIAKDEELSFDYNMHVDTKEEDKEDISSYHSFDNRLIISDSTSKNDFSELNENKVLKNLKLIDSANVLTNSSQGSSYYSLSDIEIDINKCKNSHNSLIRSGSKTKNIYSKKRKLSSGYNPTSKSSRTDCTKNAGEFWLETNNFYMPLDIESIDSLKKDYTNNNISFESKFFDLVDVKENTIDLISKSNDKITSDNNLVQIDSYFNYIKENNSPNKNIKNNVSKRKLLIDDYFEIKTFSQNNLSLNEIIESKCKSNSITNKTITSNIYDPLKDLDAISCENELEATTSTEHSSKITNSLQSNVAVKCFCESSNCRGYITKFVKYI